MNTVKEFTPVLMYVDHEKIDLLMKSAKEFQEKINSKFQRVEDFLELKLSDEKLMDLAKGGIRFVDELLFSEKFEFKKATKEFNLEAMGLTDSYKQLEIALRNSIGWIRAYDYSIIDGKASLSEKAKNDIVEKNTHYTQNEAQTDAFELAESICKDLNKGLKKGWINNQDQSNIQRGISLVKFEGSEFIPNYRVIKNINPDGGIINMY